MSSNEFKQKFITIYEEGIAMEIPDQLGEYMHKALNDALPDDAQIIHGLNSPYSRNLTSPLM